MNSLLKKALDAAMSAVPAAVSPANQYAKSYSAALCLLVSADFQFDMDEFQQASRFMEQDQILRDEGLTARAAGYFRAYVDGIKDVMSANSLDFPSIQTEMIEEVRSVTNEYRPALKNMLSTLYSISDSPERDIIDRINL